MLKYVPKIVWGLNFYGVRWCGFQVGYYSDWRDED